MPFCTESVRGEINRRNIPVYTLTSCNLQAQRDPQGELRALLETSDAESSAELVPSVSRESLLYFEINRQTRPEALEELRGVIADILDEVAIVVEDHAGMREALDHCSAQAAQLESAAAESGEYAAFFAWLAAHHMTLLGYEKLQVDWSSGDATVLVDQSSRMGLLRQRDSGGAQALQRALRREQPTARLHFAKSGVRSRVHRLTYPDYVEWTLFDAQGRVQEQQRLLGLYTSVVYSMSPRLIPVLRDKVRAVLQRSHIDAERGESHAARELLRVLETFPRDELFQASVEELFATANAVNQIQERRKVRLFIRPDARGKFVNALVYVPRDRFNTELRQTVQNLLCEAFAAEESDFSTFFSESVLVRVHFVLRVDRQQVDPMVKASEELAALESQIAQITLSWEDRLRDRLVEQFGEEEGIALHERFGDAFSPGYRFDFEHRIAVGDIQKLLTLEHDSDLAMRFYRFADEREGMLRLRLYRRGEFVPLSDVMPILENLGLRVVAERPYQIRPAGDRYCWIQEFSLIYSLAPDIDPELVRDEFEEALSRIWRGETESDSFNRLLLGTRLSWREITVLRAYARYMRQIQFPFSTEYIADTLAEHLNLTGSLIELFLTRFAPDFEGDDAWRLQREGLVMERIQSGLEQVQNLGQDRIIRQFVALIRATLRCNYFQRSADGEPSPTLAFKLRPVEIPDVPRPHPAFEIFVYSPRVEGVHLRGGKVARGGLRWSDRLEDFRTEVLGLVKAQQVKNAVIVPVGAKGGFVAKRIHNRMSREQVSAEGIGSYRDFIGALLDITDNRSEGELIPPTDVLCKDEPDPYLVVAADKGTASFSDIANELAASRNFWLGDAFASGGSAGYDHKGMGITARGAWVAVRRHFQALGIDTQNSDFSVVGIGDMAGDVFGNGMLLSPHIQLVAAFNHQHIFIDPEPNAAQSFAERQRLFQLPRSSWADYDRNLISEGGGIFERSAKAISLSAQIKQRLDIQADLVTPNELIAAILRARVDLLWNGGIGTYVKSQSESHAEVGDKANDGVRINGGDLRARVVGEGGNLGMTQLARVEYALNGGRLNTDFIDNAGGVDCSDHEVNIKILLNAVVRAGDMTYKQRNQLLVEMTDEVAELVLENNYRQTQALSLAEAEVMHRGAEYRRRISALEATGQLDRYLEFLPTDDALIERQQRGQGLTRPELAIVMAYSKSLLKAELSSANLADDPFVVRYAETAFPAKLVANFQTQVHQHELRNEIVATQIANHLVNHVGMHFVPRLQQSTGAATADIAKAYLVVWELFDIGERWAAIDALDFCVDAEKQIGMLLELVKLLRWGTRWLLRNRRHSLDPAALVEEFRPPLRTVLDHLSMLLGQRGLAALQDRHAQYLAQGAPEDLAGCLSSIEASYAALGVVASAQQSGADVLTLAKMQFAVSEYLRLDEFAHVLTQARIDNEWQALARESYLEDLEWQVRALAGAALPYLEDSAADIDTAVAAFTATQERLVQRWHSMLSDMLTHGAPDFAMFAVANRELLDLSQASARRPTETAA
jgi:glutamate dehydrogenase